jgi:extradiol dioxygenase family protein
MKSAHFHLSLPCISITETKNFYTKLLGAQLGRHTQQWIDVNLFGHQITFTKSGEFNFRAKSYKFEGVILPSFHFGVIIPEDTWKDLYESISKRGVITSAQKTFLKNQPGEHSSFFVDDPNDYTIEFKCFAKSSEVFKS